MATVSDMVLKAIEANAVPYRWPERSCVQPAIDFISQVRGAVSLPSQFAMGEARAMKDASRRFGSWERAAMCWLEVEAEADPVEGELQTGDILYFRCAELDAPLEGFAHVGLVAPSGWIYARGRDTMLPLPPDKVRILHHYRLRGLA